MDYRKEIELLLRSLRQPLLQVILYTGFYDLIIRILMSTGFIKMDIGLGIASRYLFYLYIILSLLLLFVLYFQKVNRTLYSIILIFVFFAISFYSLMNSKLFALLISFNALISMYLSHLIIIKFNK